MDAESCLVLKCRFEKRWSPRSKSAPPPALANSLSGAQKNPEISTNKLLDEAISNADQLGRCLAGRVETTSFPWLRSVAELAIAHAGGHSQILAIKLLKSGEIPHNQSLASGLTHVSIASRAGLEKQFEQTIENWKNHL